MELNREHAWALVDRVDREREPAQAHARRRSRRARLRARVRRGRRGWGVVALLHDFDYERYPDHGESPVSRRRDAEGAWGIPEWVTRAILSHADYSGVPRESRLEHTLYACDEMSGFITAAALVRPSRSVLDLEASSVVKRMKDKAFARAVNRDDLRRGAEELGSAPRRPHRQRDSLHARARPTRSAYGARCKRDCVAVSAKAARTSVEPGVAYQEMRHG